MSKNSAASPSCGTLWWTSSANLSHLAQNGRSSITALRRRVHLGERYSLCDSGLCSLLYRLCSSFRCASQKPSRPLTSSGQPLFRHGRGAAYGTGYLRSSPILNARDAAWATTAAAEALRVSSFIESHPRNVSGSRLVLPRVLFAAMVSETTAPLLSLSRS